MTIYSISHYRDSCKREIGFTVVLMIGDRESKRHVRYPSEELVVG